MTCEPINCFTLFKQQVASALLAQQSNKRSKLTHAIKASSKGLLALPFDTHVMQSTCTRACVTLRTGRPKVVNLLLARVTQYIACVAFATLAALAALAALASHA